MRERLTGSLLPIFAFILLSFSIALISPANGQQVKNRKIEKLPNFNYNTLQGQQFSNKDLKENSKLMIVYFNPLCEVCQKEIKDIITNIDYFKDIQLVLISPNTKDEITAFMNSYKLADYKQITILHDMNDVFYKEFNAIGYPSLYLYDEQKMLLEHFDSQADIREIKGAFGATTAKK